ncbi:MAG TPA: hypothetical protein PKD72_13465 [Gemmatales bacterium]|nr:hypothetical protein [Gemmatales bacterium]
MSQPTLLRTNSNHLANLVDVPVEPMVPANELNSERQVRLEILGDNILCLQPVPSRPPWLSRLTYFCFLGCLGFMIYCGVQGMVLGMERNKSITTIVWGCFAVIPALILLASLIYPFFKAGPLSYRFDRISRLMTVQRCYGFNKTPRLVATYGLQDAVALQLLYRYYKVHQAGIHTDDVKRPSYEMNLVFSNTVPPRVNLAVHPDWRWMQQAGARLAEFLELPVVDQLCKT